MLTTKWMLNLTLFTISIPAIVIGTALGCKVLWCKEKLDLGRENLQKLGQLPFSALFELTFG